MARAVASPSVQRAGARPGGEAAEGAAPGKERLPTQVAKEFLLGKRKLTSAVLVGLNQALLDPALVGRLVAAHKKGAKLGAAIGGNADLRAMVRDPKFDWGDRESAAGESGGGEGGAGGGENPPSGGAAGGTESPASGGGAEAGKAVQRRSDGGGEAGAADTHQEAAAGLQGPAQALPHRDAIQRSFGHHDVGGITAHVGGPAATAARNIGARAYASGDAVAFADPPDLHTAAHEAAHTVQQRGGVQLKGGVGEAGDAYERQADHVADLVVQGKSAVPLLDEMAAGSSGGGAPGAKVQRRDGAGQRASARLGGERARATGRGNSELDRRTDGDHQGEDGSGAWGSEAGERGLTDRANWYMWSRVATAAETIGLVNAARHMRHYLGNTGATLTVTVDNMLRDVPAFSSAYDRELAEAKGQVRTKLAGLGQLTAPQTFQLTGEKRSDVYCNKSESQDWFFAIGGFTHWWTAEVTVTPPPGPPMCTPDNPTGVGTGPAHVAMKFTMHMKDRYNWDQGKAVTIAGITVKDEQLGRLHRVGLAQEYDVQGDSTEKLFEWEESGAAPPASGAAPTGGSRDGGRTDPTGDRGSIRGNTRGSPGGPRGR